MRVTDRLFGVKRERFAIAPQAEVKKSDIPFISEEVDRGWVDSYGYLNSWTPVQWMDTSWASLVSQIYQVNAAVFQCISTLAFGYNEPPPIVKINGEVSPDHELQLLLDRPNPLMSHAELMQMTIVYRAIGGNCYLKKIRNSMGQVIELWPYHAGQMWPVPSRFNWVEEYEYDAGRGQKKRIKASEIIHLKWPAVDLRAPWQALSPLVVIARECMTDSEATRFLYALLKNDAVPRGVVTLPEGTAMSPSKADKLRKNFHDEHGGEKAGGIVILEQGAGYTRVSLDPSELAFDAMRRVPEARIAGAFRVPPIVAGLNVGLDKATYANYETAVVQMTRGTFVPLWRSDAVEYTQALAAEYPDAPVVAYNTSLVAALQENTNEKHKRAGDAFDKNIALLDESRAMIDLPPIDQVISGDVRGKFFRYELAPPKLMQPTITDVTPKPLQITDSEKAQVIAAIDQALQAVESIRTKGAE